MWTVNEYDVAFLSEFLGSAILTHVSYSYKSLALGRQTSGAFVYLGYAASASGSVMS